MNTTRKFVHVVLVIGMVLGAAIFVEAQSSSDVVLILNGEKITRADLQDQVGGRLLQPRQDRGPRMEAAEEHVGREVGGWRSAGVRNDVDVGVPFVDRRRDVVTHLVEHPDRHRRRSVA